MPSTIQRSASAGDRPSCLALDDTPPGPTWPYAPLRGPRSSIRQRRVAERGQANARQQLRLCDAPTGARPLMTADLMDTVTIDTPLHGPRQWKRIGERPHVTKDGRHIVLAEWRLSSQPAPTARHYE